MCENVPCVTYSCYRQGKSYVGKRGISCIYCVRLQCEVAAIKGEI